MSTPEQGREVAASTPATSLPDLTPDRFGIRLLVDLARAYVGFVATAARDWISPTSR